MSTPLQEKCKHCNKSSLSLLLLRPSPIALDGRLAPLGSDAVQSSEDLVDELMPSRRPTESRPVLRYLRPGFVHVYIPKPPPRVKQWLVYQVTERAELIAHTEPDFDPATPGKVCRRIDHNPVGRIALALPQAHLIDEVWLAYSANTWDETLRGRNAANPEVMHQVVLGGCRAWGVPRAGGQSGGQTRRRRGRGAGPTTSRQRRVPP